MKIELTPAEFLELLGGPAYADLSEPLAQTHSNAEQGRLTAEDIAAATAQFRAGPPACGETYATVVGLYRCNLHHNHPGPHVFEPEDGQKT